MTYKIEKESNGSIFNWKLVKSNKLKGTLEFYGYGSYTINLQAQLNRLLSLSDGLLFWKNSMSLAWRWSQVYNKIEILSCTTKKGIEFSKVICRCEPNVAYNFEMVINKDYYVYTFDTTTSIIKRLSRWNSWRVKLFPRFGGKEAAPKDIYIEIKE